MFGRKKKDKGPKGEKPAVPDKNSKGAEDGSAIDQETGDSKPKKKRNLKRLIFILLIILSLAAAGFAVYKFYFAPKGEVEKKYVKQNLEHVKLPDEIFKFTFDNLPELYDKFILFNNEILLVDGELARLNAIAKQYPGQTKIIDKEKKVWEKVRKGGFKTFEKIEKKLETIFVSFKVNRETGRKLMDDSGKDLISSAAQALKPMEELTERLKTDTPPSQGFIKDTLHKITSKFSG